MPGGTCIRARREEYKTRRDEYKGKEGKSIRAQGGQGLVEEFKGPGQSKNPRGRL